MKNLGQVGVTFWPTCNSKTTWQKLKKEKYKVVDNGTTMYARFYYNLDKVQWMCCFSWNGLHNVLKHGFNPELSICHSENFFPFDCSEHHMRVNSEWILLSLLTCPLSLRENRIETTTPNSSWFGLLYLLQQKCMLASHCLADGLPLLLLFHIHGNLYWIFIDMRTCLQSRWLSVVIFITLYEYVLIFLDLYGSFLPRKSHRVHFPFSPHISHLQTHTVIYLLSRLLIWSKLVDCIKIKLQFSNLPIMRNKYLYMFQCVCACVWERSTDWEK
jgi:hypothetical protein